MSKISEKKFSVGAVFFDCRQFNQTHKQRIMQVMQQCTHLVLFVIDSGSSSYEDIFNAVKNGMKELKNVAVIPYGNANFFEDEGENDSCEKYSNESDRNISFFCRNIATPFNISKLFAVYEMEELYTDKGKEILNEYGIELINVL